MCESRPPWVAALRGDLAGFDLVVEIDPGEDPAPWEEAGATRVLTGFGMQPRLAGVQAVTAAGPRA